MFKKTMIAGLVGMMATMSAQAVTLQAGDLKFTINNYDSGTVGYPATPSNGMVCDSITACDTAGSLPATNSYGADTWGIFSVESITRISDASLIWQASAGKYLTGLFGGLQDAYVENATSSFTGLTVAALTTGGWLNLYSNTNQYDPSQGPSGRTGEFVYTGITGGTLMLSAIFAGSAINGLDYTYYSTFKPNSSYAGSGQGFLDVTGGVWGQTSGFGGITLDTNSLTDTKGNKRDLFVDVTFNDVNGAASILGWTVTSAGQVKGNAIPEPGSMALAGLGLIGLAALRRRKQAKRE